MKYAFLCFLLLSAMPGIAQSRLELLPEWTNESKPDGDWLVRPVPAKAGLYKKGGNELVLSNGLLLRSFRIAPNAACVDFRNLVNGQQLLRAVKPEARIAINGKEYAIGGLEGQPELGYLEPRWLEKMISDTAAFHFESFSQKPVEPYIQWKNKFWASQHRQATGVHLTLQFAHANPDLQGIKVFVHYELMDGIPLLVKWVSIENRRQQAITLGLVVNEILGLVEEESAVVGKPEQMKKQHGIYVETNYAFNNAMRYDISDQTTHWKTDRKYTSQVNYNYETPCLLEIYPENARAYRLQAGETFRSVRTQELLMDSYDRERRGLAIRKMYRVLAPWTSANPIFMHLVSKNDEEVKSAIDQCVATGYEALILSFGSHLNMEDSTAANISKWKNLADYAHQRNIFIGGYSLFSSRRISDADDVIDAKTGKPGGAFFGNAPCFGSNWGLAYRNKIKYFFTETGFDIWENDGPYPGDLCASTQHPGHSGLDDSQWKQMEIQKELYRWLNERGVYINAPDWYFMDGTHKIAIGYREVNFSLPREQQKILNRQNIFDGTWEKAPSMGWGFVPLTRYQGGGPEAVLEPLQDHLDDYEQLMMQYYGAGVQACYRGPRLYDSELTRKRVSSVIEWYRKYREVLNADLLHLRRADGRDWDGWLHLNPNGKQKGLFMLFNPLSVPITRKIIVPLYYTGLVKEARISEKAGKAIRYRLNRNNEAVFTFTLPANGYSWYVVE